MLYSTHAFVGVISSELICLATGHSLTDPMTIASFAVGAIISTLPDIDQTQSFIGRRLFVFSYLLQLFKTRHRAFTHSALSMILLCIAMYFIPIDLFWKWIVLSGYFSHLLIDMFNPSGIELLWPNPIRIRLLPKKIAISTNSWGEIGFRVCAFIGMIGLLKFWL